jgi:hypothetical protein
MDGTQDSLTCGSQLTEETNDVEGALRVETRGRLVQEEKEFGLGGELDTNGYTFALFDGKTRFRVTIVQRVSTRQLTKGKEVLGVSHPQALCGRLRVAIVTPKFCELLQNTPWLLRKQGFRK